MYHLDNTSGVPEMPEPKDIQTISTRWFGESQEQGGISWPGADWFNIVQAELLAILEIAGISPEKSKFNQVAESISELSNRLRKDIVKNDGFKLVGQVPSYASLKNIIPERPGQRVLLAAYHPGGKTGGGEFIAVSGVAPDDGGTICVPAGQANWYWKRVNIASYDVTWFGAVAS
ncbi:TPA: hypothetical protein MDK45_002870, partial [Klebsiella pneumoniae]|nr:hypothetical protein [Klebsiella pneumoniae]